MTGSPLESRARARFAELLGRPEVPLDEAALAIAEEEYPGLDPAGSLRTLDALAARVRAAAGDRPRPATLLPALRAVLAGEEGFRGNRDSYQDPRNSYLNEVLSRKLGIPITLSLVYMEVARRAGLPLQGVGFPGHFLSKYVSPSGVEVFVDAFNGGEALTAEECVSRFRAVSGDRPFDPRYLVAVTPRQILGRMLHNLKSIYVEGGDDVRAYWVIDRILMLAPNQAAEVRDRGLVAARLGAAGPAARDLAAYLEAAPGALDADEVRAVLASLRARPARPN
ncbi:MAG TPA: transglutaminase-like domain-containing protein [Anaeromyxobacteraceae bacterium]|nr:transglutaminase-like domain-containing protein [Anaeromyxobacteraceae bacterium]